MNIKVFWPDSGLKYRIIFRRSGRVCSVLTHSDGTFIENLQVSSLKGTNGVGSSCAFEKDGSIRSTDVPVITLATEDAKPLLEIDTLSFESENAPATLMPTSDSAHIKRRRETVFILKSAVVQKILVVEIFERKRCEIFSSRATARKPGLVETTREMRP